MTMLEDIGNVAMQSKNVEEAIASYSAALSLNPSNPARLLVKRSKARAIIMLWEDALKDADDVWLFHLPYVTTLTEF
jgi:tetratricopeptide (TPR) repeat protein